MKTDLELQRDVVAALEQDPNVTDENIHIAVHEGLVAVTGNVPDYVQRRLAPTIAARVPGVRAVVQGLSVQVPIELDPSDAAIARQALQALVRVPEVRDEDIKVIVENGWLSLNGTVAREQQRRAAESAVTKLVGIRGSRNLIDVRPHATAGGVKGTYAASFSPRPPSRPLTA